LLPAGVSIVNLGLDGPSDDKNSLKIMKSPFSFMEEDILYDEDEEFLSDWLAISQQSKSLNEEKKKMEEKAMNFNGNMDSSTNLLEELMDAQNINDISNLFELELTKKTNDEEDAENVDDLTKLLSQIDKDGVHFMENDDLLSYLSDVDTNSSEKEHMTSELCQATSNVHLSTETSPLDARIVVPTKAIHIEHSNSKHMKDSTNPFAFCIAGPPRLSASILTSSCEKRSKPSKRKPLSEESRQNLSEVRRKRAAKRLRINGRFIQEKECFVSITKLQE